MNYQPDLWTTALRLALSLGLVLLLCWGALVLSRRFLQRAPLGAGSRLLTVLCQQNLWMKLTITMVRVL